MASWYTWKEGVELWVLYAVLFQEVFDLEGDSSTTYVRDTVKSTVFLEAESNLVKYEVWKLSINIIDVRARD